MSASLLMWCAKFNNGIFTTVARFGPSNPGLWYHFEKSRKSLTMSQCAKMILNRMRMVRQSALEEGIELDDIPVDPTIKPVNIYISQTFDSSCRDEIVKELPCLRQFDVDYNLEATESPGKESFN